MADDHGFADYLLYVDKRAVGALEAKPVGFTLSGVKPQVDKLLKGLASQPPGAYSPRFDRFPQARPLKFGPSPPRRCEMRATIQRVLHHRRNCSHPLLKSELRVFFL